MRYFLSKKQLALEYLPKLFRVNSEYSLVYLRKATEPKWVQRKICPNFQSHQTQFSKEH